MRGIIDRVDTTEDGRVRIVDYKTGRLPRVEYLWETLEQMWFYAAVWRLTTGRLPEAVRLLFLRAPGGVVDRPVTPLVVEQAIEHAHTVADQIDAAAETGEWPTRSGPLCGWCPFQAICPEWV